MSIAPDGARGETLAGLFVAAYLGLTVPVVGLGIATQLVTTRAAILGFAAVLIAVVAAVSRKQGAAQASGSAGEAPRGEEWIRCFFPRVRRRGRVKLR
jgi:hypothetical protein